MILDKVGKRDFETKYQRVISRPRMKERFLDKVGNRDFETKYEREREMKRKHEVKVEIRGA